MDLYKEVPIVKPLVDDALCLNNSEFPSEKNGLLNGIGWPSSLWQDGSRRSAFQPYKPTTVLTNLQRGNIQTHTPQLDPSDVTWFEKAGRGDLTLQDINDAYDINMEDEDGLTALIWGSAYGQTSTVQMLIEAGADVNKRGRVGESALHLAAAGGHHGLIRLLISSGAYVNCTDWDGNTPLMYAAFCDHPHSVNELLLKGADMTLPNFSDQHPFEIAIQHENIQAQLVLEFHLLSLLGSLKSSLPQNGIGHV